MSIMNGEHVSVSCECACGNRHSRMVDACSSTTRHPFTSSKDEKLRCVEAAGHKGEHYALIDMMNYCRWPNEETAQNER